MTTVNRFEVGDTKCLDEGTLDQALLIGCPKGTIVSLMFNKKRSSHAQIHELVRLLGRMGLMAVEVQTEETGRGR